MKKTPSERKAKFQAFNSQGPLLYFSVGGAFLSLILTASGIIPSPYGGGGDFVFIHGCDLVVCEEVFGI